VITASGELEEVADVHERTALVGTVRPEVQATTLMLAGATGSGRRRRSSARCCWCQRGAARRSIDDRTAEQV
jgi:hypothetical protein